MTLPCGLVTDEEFESVIDRDDAVGKGTSRSVYGVRGSSEFIIKESTGFFHHSNFVEWIVWNAVKKMQENTLGNEPNPELVRLFAECAAISYSARYVMMERLLPISTTATLQLTRFPHWLNDKKPSAFGIARDGAVKVMDYGMVDFYSVLNPMNAGSSF